MARSANQKLKLLYLCRILMEQTDEEHPLTVPGADCPAGAVRHPGGAKEYL